MDNWYRRLLLVATLASPLLASSTAQAQDDQQVIMPEIERREIGVDAIDTENIEVGLHYGIISIEDFSSSETWVARAAWHITEDFFFEASYSTATGDRTSYEKISGGAPLYSDDDRDFSQYNLALGWNALPGRIHFGENYAFNSTFYFIGGLGSTEFLGDNWFTVTLGGGYKLFLNDSWTAHIDVRDHIFDRDSFGQDETTNNIELTTGISFFF